MFGEMVLTAFVLGLVEVTKVIAAIAKLVKRLPEPLVFYVGKKLDAIKGDILDVTNAIEYYTTGGVKGKIPADYRCGRDGCKSDNCKPENGPKSAEPTSTPQGQATAIGPAPSAN